VGICWGAEGVALANVAAVALLMIPMLHFSLRQTPVTLRAFFNAISAPAAASLIMAVFLLLTRGFMSQYGMPVSIFSGLGVAAAVYGAVLLIIPRSRRDLVTLISAVLGSLKRHEQSRSAIGEAGKVAVS
jgi:hypothetical protein